MQMRAPAAGYDELRITAPAHEATLHDNEGKVPVAVVVAPLVTFHLWRA